MVKAFKVPKIKCEGCADTITKALGGMVGVTGTRVGVAEKEVHVEFDPGHIDEARVRRALVEAGFPPA